MGGESFGQRMRGVVETYHLLLLLHPTELRRVVQLPEPQDEVVEATQRVGGQAEALGRLIRQKNKNISEASGVCMHVAFI